MSGSSICCSLALNCALKSARLRLSSRADLRPTRLYVVTRGPAPSLLLPLLPPLLRLVLRMLMSPSLGYGHRGAHEGERAKRLA